MLNSVDDVLEGKLRNRLGEAAFKDAAAYVTEPRGRWSGQGVVVAPASTAEVAFVVKACAEARVGIVPYSGGTGLVGGQIQQDGPVPVVLSLERMTTVREMYPRENVMVVDAGIILADVQSAAQDAGRMFPLSLASEGSARIGGLLATNAGGVNVLRYGNARAQCLGLEVVTADGRVWNGLSRLRKDNSGYDLKDLFVGSEGTLGVITGAALRMVPQPAETGLAVFAVTSPEAALDVLAIAQAQLGDGISAFELIHRQGLDFLDEVGPEVSIPFETRPDWMVMIDVGLSKGQVPQDALEQLFVSANEAGLSDDGIIAQSLAQRQQLWTVRESIPEANRRIGSVSSHDISVPLSEIPNFISRAGRALSAFGDFRINCFGHLGDGNLHYNVFPAPGRSRADHDDDRPMVKKVVHDLVHELGGSVSAEHGVGRLKVADLETYSDPTKLAMMRSIKAALDPQGIMNPGAVLRDQSPSNAQSA